ncbi:glycosyltransferase family 2 protein [uncultured Lactobacillus sp.]|uniref:glycosyltransferase family 2 protein n=1 Tax=uncultured Lactobacillus sp. TaxID=153152 RepID=UPI002804CE06|nr:glycosyltransferase family 2 protein [uncultured Lactobacillus sp.]
MSKILTIGVAAYNAEKTISNTIESLLVPEVMDKVEILIVNDGSTDNTKEIVERYENLYPETIRVVNKLNGGHGSVINKTISIAKGIYMKIVDADDTLEKEGYVDLVNTLQNNTVDAVLSPYFTANVKSKEKKLHGYLLNDENSFYDKLKIEFNEYYKNINPTLHSITYRTSVLRNSKWRVDEKCFYEDTQYSLYYWLDINEILFLSKPVYCYWLGDENQSVNLKNRLSRRQQAINVVLGLTTFFNLEEQNMSVQKSMFFKREIDGYTTFIYKLLMALPNKEQAKEETKLYDIELKKSSSELYKCLGKYGTSKKVSRVVKLLRELNWKGYYIVYKLLNKKIIKQITV